MSKTTVHRTQLQRTVMIVEVGSGKRPQIVFVQTRVVWVGEALLPRFFWERNYKTQEVQICEGTKGATQKAELSVKTALMQHKRQGGDAQAHSRYSTLRMPTERVV